MEVLYIFLAEAARITVTLWVHSKLRKKSPIALQFSDRTPAYAEFSTSGH